MDFHLSSYFPVLIFLVFVVGFVLTTLALTHLIGPKKKTAVKDMTYESGMDPIGNARQKFDVRFYLVAILFLVFDVELLFLYPWAVSAYRTFEVADGSGAVKTIALIPEGLSQPIFWELLVFIATLVVAFVYAWRKGVFRWR
jgi:NADH-quinone oxidoreductase subunit A